MDVGFIKDLSIQQRLTFIGNSVTPHVSF